MAARAVPGIAPATRELQAMLDGSLHLPGDPGYDRARTPWNLAVDQRPAAVAVPRNAAEVVRVVRAAAALGLRVAPQSSGHNAGPLAGRLSEAVLLSLSGLSAVAVDPERRVARVTGGAAWQQVAEAADAFGLAGLHGSGPDIAVAGYTLGGGLSWYARKFGLACNHVDAVEVVTADGRLRRVHANHEPELFWALRGGGGNFGVVTALDLRLLPLRDVYAGVLLWDASRAPEVCRAWAEWTHDLPEEATTSLRLLGRSGLSRSGNLFPPGELVVIDGAVLADDDRAGDLLAPLRALRPTIDTFSRVAARSLTRLHFDPELPTAGVSDSLLLDDVDGDAVDALLSVAGPGSRSSLVSAEIRHLGGALGRSDPAGGALPQLAGEYSGFFLAGGATSEQAERGRTDAAAAVAALQPWSRGRRLGNFTESRVEPASLYDPGTLARLRSVRAQVDPSGVFLANHGLA